MLSSLFRFGLVYADQASLLLSSCYIHDRVSQRSHLLEFLLESSTALFTCVPEANSLAATKGICPSFPLLQTQFEINILTISISIRRFAGNHGKYLQNSFEMPQRPGVPNLRLYWDGTRPPGLPPKQQHAQYF